MHNNFNDMKRGIRQSIRPLVPLAICLIGLILLSPKTSSAALHGALAIQNPVGPTGTPEAHVGDTITTSIRVQNLDEFGDSLTITNIIYIVHLGAGDVRTTNLLLSPVVLTSFGDFGDVVYAYVLPTIDQDYLVAHARVEGRDDFDAPGGSGVVEGFTHTVPGIVQILRPCLKVTANGGDPAGEVEDLNQSGDQGGAGTNSPVGDSSLSTGSVRNCGNCLLLNVVVSNFLNGTFSYVLGPTDLDAGQVIRFTNNAPLPERGKSGSRTLFAWGTDQTGLLVSNCTCAATAPDDGGQGDQGNQGGRGSQVDVASINTFRTTPAVEVQDLLAGGISTAPYHGVFVYSSAIGPDGTSRVQPGDQVTIVIGIMNIDDFGDTITITNVTDFGRHANGDVAGRNLLSEPVTLDSYLVFGGTFTLEITNTYRVLPSDRDFLFDYADVRGRINFDGPNGFNVPGGFESIVGTQARVLRPSIHMAFDAKNTADGHGTVSLRWDSIAGKVYQVQYTTNLTQMNWTNLGNPVNATNAFVGCS